MPFLDLITTKGWKNATVAVCLGVELPSMKPWNLARYLVNARSLFSTLQSTLLSTLFNIPSPGVMFETLSLEDSMKTDVFICGGGPVGLVMAYMLARQEISTYLVGK